MQRSDQRSRWSVCSLLSLSLHVFSTVTNAHGCMLPDFLQKASAESEPWYTNVRRDGTRETEYHIHHNVLEIRHRTPTTPTVRWKCTLTFQGKFLLKRRDSSSGQEFSTCVKFIRRSASIVQAMWSREIKSVDPALCEDRNLVLDPWLLVSFKLVLRDYTPSPFRGGYSMRITESELGENACNYMHRPMKLESDCLTGEGVLFDFISENCLPGGKLMFVKQRTLPLASWEIGDNYYVILRRRDDTTLFCLRVPATSEDHMNAFLFTDLACLTERESVVVNVAKNLGIENLVLHLQKHVYRQLCDDEYPQCSAVTCNSYIKQECHKSCGVCDPDTLPEVCSFPRRVRGFWHQSDVNGFRTVNVTDSEFSVENLGDFRCVHFPDSPLRRSRMYTTISMFSNGCRPRYTCLRFKRLGPSVMRYALSRSFVWPSLENDIGKAICSESQFGTDPEPINDLYRSHEDTGKPIISFQPPPLEHVPCNLSSSYSVAATFPNGSICHGSMYEHCEDKTRLRMEFYPGCGEVVEAGEVSKSLSATQTALGPLSTDFSCLADFEGHYWERLLLVQNVADERDTRCLAFTRVDASSALMTVSGQCDKNSFSFVAAGLRAPLMTLSLRPEQFPCKYLPISQTPSPSRTSAPVTSWQDVDEDGLESYTLHAPESSTRRGGSGSVSFSVTLQPSPRTPNPHISAPYQEPAEEEKTLVAHTPGLSLQGKESNLRPSSQGGSSAVKVGVTFHFAFQSSLLVVVVVVNGITR